MNPTPSIPQDIAQVQADLLAHNYVADRQLATAVFLALRLQRPLFLEGEPGTGKTEIARVLSAMLERPLIRLQCYEGLDLAGAAYEWNYGRQMMEIRLAEGTGADRSKLADQLFSDKFLIQRALLQAIDPKRDVPPVLLIDELDRADEPFEAFLLEVLSEFQITIPEYGTVKATTPPIVILTSNRTREIHDAVKRRCLYHWVGFPDAAREYEIVQRRVPGVPQGAGAAGGGLRAEAARDRAVQAARHRRDDRMGARSDGARCAGARPGGDPGHAGRAAEVPGRHRPHAGRRGCAHPRRGAQRVAGGGLTRRPFAGPSSDAAGQGGDHADCDRPWIR